MAQGEKARFDLQAKTLADIGETIPDDYFSPAFDEVGETREDKEEFYENGVRPLEAIPKKTKSNGSSKNRSKGRIESKGLKKSSLLKAKKLDMPPTPVGCEWRDADGGWNLFRCWSEKDEVLGGRFKKERYVGYLSREAWQVLKQYEYETFISIIGQRFRRHSGR